MKHMNHGTLGSEPATFSLQTGLDGVKSFSSASDCLTSKQTWNKAPLFLVNLLSKLTWSKELHVLAN